MFRDIKWISRITEKHSKVKIIVKQLPHETGYVACCYFDEESA